MDGDPLILRIRETIFSNDTKSPLLENLFWSQRSGQDLPRNKRLWVTINVGFLWMRNQVSYKNQLVGFQFVTIFIKSTKRSRVKDTCPDFCWQCNVTELRTCHVSRVTLSWSRDESLIDKSDMAVNIDMSSLMMVRSKLLWQVVKLHASIKNSLKQKIKMKWPLDDATNKYQRKQKESKEELLT